MVGSIGILAVLDREGKQDADALARRLKLSPHTVRHHLDRLRRWGQAVAVPEVEQIRVKQPRRRVVTTLPVRTLLWSITPRGRARLRYVRERDGDDR